MNFTTNQTKLRVFPLDIRTQTHHKRASNGHCGERCTGLPMEKIYDNDPPSVDSPSTAALQLVAATLPHEAEEQLWNEKLEFNPLEGSSTLLLGYT